LVSRGYDVKSASSSIDNITAQSLIEELSVTQTESNEKEPPSDKSQVGEAERTEVPFVKTKQDLDREREEKEKAVQLDKDLDDPSTQMNLL